MKRFNVKTVFIITTAAISFASVSAQAMPITSSGSTLNSYLSPLNDTSLKNHGLSVYQDAKAKNIALESLNSLLKKISIKKDDFNSNVEFNNVNDLTKLNDKDHDVKTSKVPEPSSLLLLGLGIFGIAGLRKKKAA